MNAKKSVSMKVVVLLLAVVLVIGCAAGGTLAWLMSKSETVTNTFVVGNIGGLELAETGDDGTHANDAHTYKIIPGVNIAKKPTVTYTPAAAATSTENVPVYVFLKVEANAGWTANVRSYSFADGKITWAVADGWTVVPSAPGVFYKKVDDVSTAATWDVMAKIGDTNKTITVSSNIAKSDVSTIADAIGSLSFTAYAIQQEGFGGDISAAWTAAQSAT